MDRKLTLDEIDALEESRIEVSGPKNSYAPIDRSPRPAREYDGDIYDESYYLHGKETGKSLYQNYRWLSDLTIPMCRRIVEYLGITQSETINDFGCARGYVVKALRLLGYDAYGQDISEWAIANADPGVACRLTRSPFPQPADWTIAKDVLEHLMSSILDMTLLHIARVSHQGFFIVVPLAGADGRYVVPEYEMDVTHRQRLGLHEWRGLVHRACRDVGGEWDIDVRFRIEGIKDNWAHYEEGNGFLTARRVG